MMLPCSSLTPLRPLICGPFMNPELDVVGLAVVPENRGFAGRAAYPYDLPGVADLDDVAVLVFDSVAAFDLRAVHEPELDVVGLSVVPENV